MDDEEPSHRITPHPHSDAVKTPVSFTRSSPSRPVSTSSRLSSTPKLGDFSRLRSAVLSSSLTLTPTKPTAPASSEPSVESLRRPPKLHLTSDSPGESVMMLGDFVSGLTHLDGHSDYSIGAWHARSASSRANQGAPQRKSDLINMDGPSVIPKYKIPFSKEVQDSTNSADDTDKEHGSETDVDALSFVTRATTPPSPTRHTRSLGSPTNNKGFQSHGKWRSPELDRSPEREHTRRTSLPSPPSSPLSSRRHTPSPSDEATVLFNWQYGTNGPLTRVYGTRHSHSKKHESLTMDLIPLRGMDGLLNVQHPLITANGIHVFLDMSNIQISFQKALKAKYGIPDEARLVPFPGMNLAFLTQILVRGRQTKVLNAGCSVPPGRNEPQFVKELRRLDYHVDLRERKRIDEKPYNRAGNSSSDEFYGNFSPRHKATARYVEDLVDETLQTRIGESVMEHFDRCGTLVLATGDAKPAKYSDGFYVYADRALRMGWSVEIVSWRSSLSSTWRNPAWAKQWGHRLRIIELDEFLDDLIL